MAQPLLPPPVDYTPPERSFIDESPPGLWPRNQDSNFGAKRKSFTDQLNILLGWIATLYNERFVDTSVRFLSQWEEQMGLPINSGLTTISQRQGSIRQRLRRGAFTRTLRNQLIEDAVRATFGPVPAFGPGGIPIGSGIRLFAGTGDVRQYYQVVENIENFSYQVIFDQAVSVDRQSLINALTWLTPSGISFTIGTAHPKGGGAKSSGKGGGSKFLNSPAYIKTGGGKANSKGGGFGGVVGGEADTYGSATYGEGTYG